jgi:hypothetical protein
VLVIKVVAVLALICLTVEAIERVCTAYDASCKKRFGQNPLYARSVFACAAIATFVFLLGLYWYHHSKAINADLSNAITLLVLGGLGIAYTFVVCVRASDFFHGTIAALVALGGGSLIIPLLLLAMFFALLAALAEAPVLRVIILRL